MVAAIVNGPRAVRLHQDRVVGVGDQIVIFPCAGIDADVGHANHRQAIPAFAAHRAAGALFANGGSRFAVAQIAGEEAVGDDRRALRGNAFVVVGERAEAGAVLEARVGNHVDDVRAVFQLAQFFDGEKTHAREICFHAENAIELDGMADGFVNLQAELRAIENDGALPFGALRGGMQRDAFFGDARRVADEIERFDQLVALQHVLPAETIGVRALLNFGACKTGGHDSRAGLHLDLMDRRSRCWKRKAGRFFERPSSLRRR